MRRALPSITALTGALTILIPAVAGSTPAISQAKLTSELLTQAQMPSGWTVANAGTSDGVGCVHALLEPTGVTQTHSAQVYYLGTVDELPRFDEKIATYSNTKKAYKKVIAKIDSCHSLSGVVDGLTITGSVGPMSYAHYGNASSAYSMTVSDARGTLHYDYLIVRKGAVLAAFLEGSYPEVSSSEFSSLVGKGVKKLS